MGKLMCYVGLFSTGTRSTSDAVKTVKDCNGGIAAFEVGADGYNLEFRSAVPMPDRASALKYSRELGTLYAVNEKKTGGRGEQERGSAVFAFRVDPKNGSLQEINHVPSMGPSPTDLAVVPGNKYLCVASHGGSDHVEKIVQDADGSWHITYDFDDATTALHPIAGDGSLGNASAVARHQAHGQDPNQSPQHGGHAQQCGHAHCTVIDPSGKFVLVGDKGADRVYVYRLENNLSTAFIYQFEQFSGARHIAFNPTDPRRVYVTLEFSSRLASFGFDPATGELHALDQISTIEEGFAKRNEPATLRVSRNGKFIYVNNRGEDTIITVEDDGSGRLTRKSAFQIGKSADPGLATRQMELTPDGKYLFVAERPAYAVRVLALHEDGTLSDVAATEINNPACICFAELPD
ncbi:MAG: lactonase family protein [Oscillospiraceae bacterium]|nr:lactonase family protein [Oscillospiraceae bacterium]